MKGSHQPTHMACSSSCRSCLMTNRGHCTQFSSTDGLPLQRTFTVQARHNTRQTPHPALFSGRLQSPAHQGLHCAAPEVAARPAAHGTGAALPPVQLLPGGQSAQMKPDPASMRWRPGGQPAAGFRTQAVPVHAEGPAAVVLPSEPCGTRVMLRR